ncbi:hypothetical protein pb186bvf_011767 [Paramecium bursaria]
MSKKLLQIRELIQSKNLFGYLVTHNDAHDSEYISDSDERLAFISGFTGSAGIGLITKEVAYLWTDSRYFIQAQKQLELGWELKKIESGYTPWFNYAAQHLKGHILGYDPRLVNAATVLLRQKYLHENDVQFQPVVENLVDLVWENKIQEKTNEIEIHSTEYAGEDAQSKIKRVFQYLKNKKFNTDGGLLIGKLDQIAWVLNLRGQDIKFNPVFKSFLYLNEQGSTLFINKEKINEKVAQYLNEIGLQLEEYEEVYKRQFVGVIVTEEEINHQIYLQLKDQHNIKLNPIEHLKAIKNEREQLGFRESHIRDGAALVGYIGWLNNELQKGTIINEHEGALKLEQYRRKAGLNKGLSFSSISSAGANAAIVHYHPDEQNSSRIDPAEIYLIDSGGQYYDGTTDVTRTYHFTNSTQEQRNAYTRVLLGNLDLERVKFPKNGSIHGGDLDVLARRWLWADNLDYGHGTGHGVGYFLNVHEGPQGISKYRTQPFEIGMIVSNEPGYYKEGSFGIRIENLIICVDKGNDYLGFDNITLCPYDRNLIDLELLSPKDRKYIDDYHLKVRETLLPLVEEEISRQWLIRMTEPL